MRVLAVTSVRNEGPYLLEWIAHHMAAGFTDFLIYSNDCHDGTHEMLIALHEAGVVTHVDHVPEDGKSIQWQALRQAWRHDLRKAADWILVSDVDEFLNIHAEGHRVADLLSKVPEETDAIVLPWRLFGNNEVVEILDIPTTEQFTRAIPADAQYPIAASFFKTLFRPSGPFNQFGVHRPKQKRIENAGLPKIVDGSGNAAHPALVRRPQRLSLYDLGVARELVELNHYSLRSASGFLVKRDRGLPNRSSKGIDLAYWVERNFNTVEDKSISRMAQATKIALEELKSLPQVSEWHDHALQWHQNRFTSLAATLEGQELLSQILCAGDSLVPRRELQKQLVRWYQMAIK